MAYASVASLLNTIELLLTSNSRMLSQICDHREEFELLREKVRSLEVFVKKFENSNDSREMKDLEAQIKEVADDVEMTIQLRLTDVIMEENEMQKEKARERLCDSLKQVAEEIDRIEKESTKIQSKAKQSLEECFVQASSSAKVILNDKNNMVGRVDERKRMLEELTKDYSGELKVIPIVGMGGIGKTTLAKEVFDDTSIRSHFDVHAWATVSQQHKVKDILVSLLQSTKGKDDTLHMEDESELADMLQKSLKSRRYLIVLDDMWSDKAWEDVRLCFPSDENRGSRILLTTRITEVARSAGTKNISLPIGLMSRDESWDLFKSAAFVNEALPSEFETIGKQIVDQCQGLPLTIVVVAGLLSKSKRTIEVWENVGKSFLTNDPDEQCLRVLGLSYNHLRSDLKACLLYFGIFEEDSEVQAKVLMRFWMAEGFLKFEKDMEGVAEKCLQDLVDRCLVLVSDRSLDGTRIKYCKVHDLIYELCLREIQKQKLVVMNDIVYADYKVNDHKLCYNLDEDEDDLAAEDEKSSRFKHMMGPFKRQIEEGESSFDCYRTLLTPGHKSDDADNNLLKRTRSVFLKHTRFSRTFSLESKLFHFSLLRILDLSDVDLEEFPPQILCLIWLRCLVLKGKFHEIPADIGRLRDLQTFIVYCFGDHDPLLPNEIWELTQLRYLEMIPSFELPNPPKVSADEQRYSGFPNIHTILGLSHECCTKEVISGIRNVTRLKVRGRGRFGQSLYITRLKVSGRGDYGLFRKSQVSDNLVNLHQLEKLSLVNCPSAKAFPLTLRKLTLLGTLFGNKWRSWDELNIIGELPNLEVLKLMVDAVFGEEWCPIAGGFSRLKVLMIQHTGLKYWKITNEDFPVLERLMIKGCKKLEELPIEFAETNSLKLIELVDSSPQLEDSARRIQQEQEDIGNNPVDVRILRTMI